MLLSFGTSRQFGIASAAVKIVDIARVARGGNDHQHGFLPGCVGTQANGPTKISAEECGGTSAAARCAVCIGCQSPGKLSFADAGA